MQQLREYQFLKLSLQILIYMIEVQVVPAFFLLHYIVVCCFYTVVCFTANMCMSERRKTACVQPDEKIYLVLQINCFSGVVV